MSGQITFTMIKPDAVADGHIGAILGKITEAGFKIKAMKLTQLTVADAKNSMKYTQKDLLRRISRLHVFCLSLLLFLKKNAVEDFRKLIGATNPAEAAEGTIRKMFARSVGENAVHGSDSDENALIEASFHFAGREIF